MAKIARQVYSIRPVEDANTVWVVKEVSDKVVADDGQEVTVEYCRIVDSIWSLEVVFYVTIIIVISFIFTRLIILLLFFGFVRLFFLVRKVLVLFIIHLFGFFLFIWMSLHELNQMVVIILHSSPPVVISTEPECHLVETCAVQEDEPQHHAVEVTVHLLAHVTQVQAEKFVTRDFFLLFIRHSQEFVHPFIDELGAFIFLR